MARERWFFAESGERRGPLGLGPLLSALVQERDPRSVLVWRRGFAAWTRAEDVPEIEQRLAPLLARPTGRIRRDVARGPAAAEAPPVPRAPSRRRPAFAIGLAVACALAGALALWWLWPAGVPKAPPVTLPFESASREGPAGSPAAGRGEPTPTPAEAATGAAHPDVARRSVTPSPARVADREEALPPEELRRLRGVAGWSGRSLRLTVVNGTAWRVTEVSVRVARFVGDEFVYADQPVRLRPPSTAVASGVDDLLQRVAPDRRKPGLNPLDTGVFVGQAGARPESFRWEIAGARGYPPAPPSE